ncbi:hypothetical protein LBMAG42_53460 [Deltaproteobacteria bacterium]|nr:hypothetical protein LBMAG42_53460 [Deltaproteobacteria bacterium]
MSTFWWIVRKELALFFADPKGAAMVIVVPLVLGVMMGFIFNPSDGPSPIAVVVVNEDGGPEVGKLIERLGRESSLKVEALSAAEAREGVSKGDIGVAVDFGPGSSAHLKPAAMFASGERASLTMWVDPSHKTEADIVQGLLTKVMMESVFAEVGDPASQRKMFDDLRADLGASGAERPELARFLDQGAAFAGENEARVAAPGAEGAAAPAAGGGMALKPPLDIVIEPVVAAGPTAGFNGFAHTFAGMLMQFLLFSASGHAKTLFAERNAGTLDRLRMTMASKAQILLGTAAAIGVVSMLASAVVFGAAMLFFDVSLRSGPLAFGLVVLGQAALVGSFSLLLAGLANSEKQLDSLGTMAILFLCFVSGAWVPAFMLPEFMQQLGPFVPTRWLLDGMAGATWRGVGLLHAGKCAGALFGFSAIFAAIGLRRFKWG